MRHDASWLMWEKVARLNLKLTSKSVHMWYHFAPCEVHDIWFSLRVSNCARNYCASSHSCQSSHGNNTQVKMSEVTIILYCFILKLGVPYHEVL